MCKHITGTEEFVKTIRLMNTVRDNLNSSHDWTVITSGSFGEGIEMKGSDLDVMLVMKEVEIHENESIHINPNISHFKMETEDTHPGFTKLRLIHSHDRDVFENCIMVGRDHFFSNFLNKQRFACKSFPTIHGPCISDKGGYWDFAMCLRCTSWITSAFMWISRSNNSWPGYDVKQYVVKHGVLYVPIGMKGSEHEDLEWRISFSVAEKLLIYTFSHTQLLCYALLKILLKDVIESDLDCKELLCSYYMKTIMLWISEELPISIWKPTNLISCYKKCFRRLVYYIENSMCPHYFIPEYNLFENKINGDARKVLLRKLNGYGWQCIFFSDQIPSFHEINIEARVNFVHTDKTVLSTLMNRANDERPTLLSLILKKVIGKVLTLSCSKIKRLYICYMSRFCSRSNELLSCDHSCNNKDTYKRYNNYICTLLLNTHHDAASGWLALASFFYKTKQNNTAVDILQYCFEKCTTAELYLSKIFSGVPDELLYLKVSKKMTILQFWKILLLAKVHFIRDSGIIPDELQCEIKMGDFGIPPLVFAHFLRFLCHHRRKNNRQCCDALRDLELTIQESSMVPNIELKAFSYNILGVSFVLFGDIQKARQAFIQSIELLPDIDFNYSSYQRLNNSIIL